jgi:Tfp pilus assembly protein PilF
MKPAQPTWHRWWPWLAGFAGLCIIFVVYSPAVNGTFVFDDQYLPFFRPDLVNQPLSSWVTGNRPLLMMSFWIDHRLGGASPTIYHASNILFHFITSLLVVCISAKLLEWAGVARREQAALAIFGGGLFLLHPVQTESVAYIASRSETLSALFCFTALAVFLYRSTESVTWARALAITLLCVAAIATKEKTLMLPALLVLTNLYWKPRDLSKNWRVYTMLTVAGSAGAMLAWRALRTSDAAGFHIKGLTPISYLWTQCRVIWIYLRLFILPFGQNIDPEVPISTGPLDRWAILGMVSLIVLVAAAWARRRRYPLASFGIVTFLLLLAPTSSFIPAQDAFAEHRLYLPFLGLALVPLEFLRRLKPSRVMWAAASVLMLCSIVTYRRSHVWSGPLALWQDTAAKSPHKVRPRFQLAFAYYAIGRCREAADNYEIASRLAPPDYRLLLDRSLALDCAGRPDEAVRLIEQALSLEPTAHAYATLGMFYAKQRKFLDALTAFANAERTDANFAMTYAYRGSVFELMGNPSGALGEYRRALSIDALNPQALAGLRRASTFAQKAN